MLIVGGLYAYQNIFADKLWIYILRAEDYTNIFYRMSCGNVAGYVGD